MVEREGEKEKAVCKEARTLLSNLFCPQIRFSTCPTIKGVQVVVVGCVLDSKHARAPQMKKYKKDFFPWIEWVHKLTQSLSLKPFVWRWNEDVDDETLEADKIDEMMYVSVWASQPSKNHILFRFCLLPTHLLPQRIERHRESSREKDELLGTANTLTPLTGWVQITREREREIHVYWFPVTKKLFQVALVYSRLSPHAVAPPQPLLPLPVD